MTQAVRFIFRDRDLTKKLLKTEFHLKKPTDHRALEVHTEPVFKDSVAFLPCRKSVQHVGSTQN